MIVRCLSSIVSEVPEAYLGLAPEQHNGVLDICPDKYYVVYALRKDEAKNVQWYFILCGIGLFMVDARNGL